MNPSTPFSALQNDSNAIPTANTLPTKATSGLLSPTNKDVECDVRLCPGGFFAVVLNNTNNAAQQTISDNNSAGLFDTLRVSTDATAAAMADPTALWWPLGLDCHIFEPWTSTIKLSPVLKLD